MRILCCLNDDVVSNVALNLLLPALTSHDVRIGLSTRIGGGATNDPRPREELRVSEQRLFNDVVFPAIDRAALPRGNRYLTFGEIERHLGFRVARLPSPNAGEGLAFLQAFAPDVMVSIRYGAIFKAAAIAVPRLGILNLHAGLLPAYRGVIASFRALMAGEREIGCTLHYISDGTIDTGPVVSMSRVPVDPTRSLFWHVLSLYPGGVAMIADALTRVVRGERLPVQSQSGGSYYSYPSAEEWDEFLRRGWRVADPSDLYELALRYA
jgi:methionyl-tRNA formyltransferase